MRSRFLILITMTCSVLATATTTATAGSEQRSDIPACQELLTRRQAEVAMGEPNAFIMRRKIKGRSTVNCVYAGGSKGPLGTR